MYLGTSLLPLPFSTEFIYKFAEPGLVIGGGWLLSGIATLPGVWLMIAGASLFINNHLIYYKQRQAILDIRDAEIEARNMEQGVRRSSCCGDGRAHGGRVLRRAAGAPTRT